MEKNILPETNLSKKRKAASVKGFKEMKLLEQGKIKGKSGADLLKELKNYKG